MRNAQISCPGCAILSLWRASISSVVIALLLVPALPPPAEARGAGKGSPQQVTSRKQRESPGKPRVLLDTFRTGAIRLRSGIELHIVRGATVRFDPDPAKYLPAVQTRWEGVEVMNYSALISAVGAVNVAVTGKGILDGDGSDTTWWPWAGKAQYGEPCPLECLAAQDHAARGGTIEHVYVKDVAVRLVGRSAIEIDLFYEEGRNGGFVPTVRYISVDRMRVASCDMAFNIVGHDDAPIRSIRLTDCRFDGVQKASALKNIRGFEAAPTMVNGKEFRPPAE